MKIDCLNNLMIRETLDNGMPIIIIDTSLLFETSQGVMSDRFKFVLVKADDYKNPEFTSAFARHLNVCIDVCKQFTDNKITNVIAVNNMIPNYVLYINDDAQHSFNAYKQPQFGAMPRVYDPESVYGSRMGGFQETTVNNGCATWQLTNKPLHGRNFSSLYLPNNQKTMILDTINEFFDPESIAFYKEHNINSKLAILLYGVPGTGKTSLIKAIANQYKLAIATMNLSSSKMSDEGVRDAFQSIPENSILVIEEVDAFFTKNRESVMRNTVTFSSLLDAIDGGISHTHQLIIMTTNHKERLDPAILRPGRIDVCIAFDFIAEEQVIVMTKDFKKTESDESIEKFAKVFIRKYPDTTPAFLQSLLVKYRKESLNSIIAMINNNTIDSSLHTQKDIIAEKQVTTATSGYIF
jgi:hypothetical protein